MRKFLSMMVVLMLPLAMLGCGDDDPVTPDPTPNARVMAVHVSPDAPGIDVFVDGTKVKTNLTYPNNTGYLAVDAGTRNIRLNTTGTSTVLFTANQPLTENINYSVFAVNTLTGIEPLVLVDDLTNPASGQARVRFVHLSPDAPAIDITTSTGTVVYSNYVFKESSTFTPMVVGTHDLEVRAAGTTTVLMDLPVITLTASRVYTVFLRGLVAGTGPQSLGVQLITNK